MGIGKIMCAIFIPLGVIILVILLVYIFGNVYNGLCKRRTRVEHSWYELTKSLKKSYELIPSIIQNVKKLSNKDLGMLKDIYKQYLNCDLVNMPPYDVASLDEAYQSILDKLFLDSKKEDKDNALDYVEETRKLTNFSIPLYNHNVRDYQRFKNMFVNKTVAKIFGFKDGEEFVPDPNEVNSTLDMRIRDFIKNK